MTVKIGSVFVLVAIRGREYLELQVCAAWIKVLRPRNRWLHRRFVIVGWDRGWRSS